MHLKVGVPSIVDACAAVCESRAASLSADHEWTAMNEARKCASAIRSGWKTMLAKLGGVEDQARPGELAEVRGALDLLLVAHEPAFGCRHREALEHAREVVKRYPRQRGGQ